MKLRIVESTRPVAVGNSMNLQIMEVLKYLIPHEGMITILESGSIEIVNNESTTSGSTGRTIIPASEGVKHDFREIINSRMTGSEKVVNMVRENPGLVASTVGKTAAAALAL